MAPPPSRFYDALQAIFKEIDSVLVAYSGGVDSALVMKVAHDTLGPAAVAATSISPTFPPSQLDEAKRVAATVGVRHLFVRSDELQIPGYAENDRNRCYLCKNDLYTLLTQLARNEGIQSVADGTNLDDLSDVRPGLKAARELGVRSPLVEAGLDKAAVRALSRALKLPNWEKPASACLSSRFPYGTPITYERLDQVGRAEEAVRRLGFKQFRVRYHGETARIEIAPEEFPLLRNDTLRLQMLQEVKACGFSSATIDPNGYRQGNLNLPTATPALENGPVAH
ncbi:MAG TPA: ATP-dependent sacrificial sulfur transferase LarE [Candidatus Manganitrophaceae bacterium]|nr:ATP-dependent sacrificial sulfur transferase LarE [Candidatus Manganitrophaceae bacterium]